MQALKKIHEATIEDFQANRTAIANAIKDSLAKIEQLTARIRNLEVEDAYNKGIMELLVAQKENQVKQELPAPKEIKKGPELAVLHEREPKQENPIIPNPVIEPEKKSDVID